VAREIAFDDFIVEMTFGLSLNGVRAWSYE
jgi:hypothetical protein